MTKCDECGEKSEYDTCPDCCDHTDSDYKVCYTCGKEMGEIWMGRAEAMAEGDR